MRAAIGTATLLIVLSVIGACAPVARFDSVEIEQELSNLLELHTYEHIYRDVVYFGEEKTFLGLRTVDRRILFSIDIRVRAGVDLQSGLRITADKSDRARVYVQLPPAEILSVDADETSIHQYFIREQGGAIGLLELTDQLEEVKTRISEDAVDRGILDAAQDNAERIVMNFLSLAGFTTVVFAPPSVTDDEEIQG
jgi:hypothetical protein